MIEFRTGDILTADAEALVNTVNCVGVMGRGIALQFKQAFPENFRVYEAACKRDELRPGRMFVFETGTLTNPKYIINFPTKRDWRSKSRMADIESGLTALVTEVRARRIHSIAIPPLGAGLGGLAWPDVRIRIEKAMSALDDVAVWVYEPKGPPPSTKRLTSAPPMTPGRAALVGLVDRYLGGLLDPFVTLLEVHKLMYFMQEAGQKLRLSYAKGHYGPYAENLRHVLREIEGHMISGYADGGDAPDKQLRLVPGAIEEARTLLASDTDARNHFDRVANLVAGFETPFGMELLATVHWVATHENARDVTEVATKVYAWGDRKKRFTQRQIELALAALSQGGWLTQATKKQS